MLNKPEDPAAIAKFIDEVATTESEWVVVATEFLMIHSRLTHWKNGINSARYAGDVKNFIDDLWTYLIQNTYRIAGYQNSTTLTPLTTTQAYCDKFGLDCRSSLHATPERIQHAIADTVSMCGGLCSGNPYDSSASIFPTGWGDAHEIGHNLQLELLKIYGGQSNEVSNNIYPYAIYQKFNDTQTDINKMEGRGVDRESRTDATPHIFNFIKTSLSEADPTAFMKEKIWSKPGIYDDNSYRYSFYINLVAMAKYSTKNKMEN